VKRVIATTALPSLLSECHENDPAPVRFKRLRETMEMALSAPVPYWDFMEALMPPASLLDPRCAEQGPIPADDVIEAFALRQAECYALLEVATASPLWWAMVANVDRVLQEIDGRPPSFQPCGISTSMTMGTVTLQPPSSGERGL
jgi:hypothetical protein